MPYPSRRWFDACMPSPRPALAATLLLALTPLAGCADPNHAPTPPTTQATSTNPTGSASASAGPVSMATAPSSAAVDLAGSRSVTSAGNRYRLELEPLARSRQTVVLTAHLVAEEVTQEVPPNRGLLADGHDALSQARGSMNGIGLVDTDGQKLYMPATTDDSPASAVCSPSFPTMVKTGDEITLSCTYAQVPAGLASVDVNVPSFGTFAHVAIR